MEPFHAIFYVRGFSNLEAASVEMRFFYNV